MQRRRRSTEHRRPRDASTLRSVPAALQLHAPQCRRFRCAARHSSAVERPAAWSRTRAPAAPLRQRSFLSTPRRAPACTRAHVRPAAQTHASSRQCRRDLRGLRAGSRASSPVPAPHPYRAGSQYASPPARPCASCTDRSRSAALHCDGPAPPWAKDGCCCRGCSRPTPQSASPD